MPIDTQTAFRAFDLPTDGPLGHQAIIDQIASAKKSLRLFMYGWTETAFADALADAHDRGVDLKCLLDHTQSAGPSEVALLHRFWLRVPPSLCRITTSPLHQIMHRKTLVLDGDADVPDQQFPTIEAATASGYPRIITGSTNWSPTAFKQSNDLLIVPGKAFASVVMAQFDVLWDWATQNEPQYQPSAPAA